MQRSRIWLAGGAAWLALALVTAVQNYSFAAWLGRELPVWPAVWRELVMFGSWAVLTPGIVWVTLRLPRWAHVPGVIVASITHSALLVAIHSAIVGEAPPSFVDDVISIVGRYFVIDVLFYAAVVFVVMMVVAMRAKSRLAVDLAEARLEALRGQLQPHFLFNALHAVSSLIDSDPPAARKTIVRLSDLLRATLEVKAPAVSLAEELALLDRYLDIQRVRFRDRLAVTIDVPDPVRVAAVPPLILQPLVENALQHGIGKRPGPGTLEITAKRTGDRLTLVVRDDGGGLAETYTERIGLGTTRARLAALGEASLTLANRDRGVEARIELPWRVL